MASLILALATTSASTWSFQVQLSAHHDLGHAYERVIEWWQSHPYVTPPPAFVQRFVDPSTRRQLHDLRLRHLDHALPSPAERHHTRQELYRRSEAFLALTRTLPREKWAFVPSDGLWQRGWLGHLFVHTSWASLLAHLGFLLFAALFFERRLGSWRLGLLYLAGGVAAAVGQTALALNSPVPVTGAAGAVAACLGALGAQGRPTVLLAWGTPLTVPSGTGAGVWLAGEAVGWGAVGGVGWTGLGAPIAGLMVGVGIGLIRRDRLPPRASAHFFEGLQRLLDTGQRGEVEVQLRAVLARNPTDPHASAMLARLLLEQRDRVGATRVLEPVLVAEAEHNSDVYGALMSEFGAALWPEAMHAHAAELLEHARSASLGQDASGHSWAVS